MTQDEPKFDPSLTQEPMNTEQLANEAAEQTDQDCKNGKLGPNPTAWKIAVWAARIAINQAIEADRREVERLKEVENGNLLKSRTFEQAVKRASDSVKNEQALQAIIQKLEAKVLLLREALKPAAEKWRYSGFTKAGTNPTTEYFDIRVTRDELAAMHTAYHDIVET